MGITIDGTATNSGVGTTTLTLTLTTSKTNDVIEVAAGSVRSVANGHTTISGIADGAGLSWAKRSSVTLDNAEGASSDLEVWRAVSTGALSADVITVTFNASVLACSGIAFGINGADTTTIWDANVSVPATATSSSGSVPTITGISTTTANDIALAFMMQPDTGTQNGGTIGGTSATFLAGVIGSGVAAEKTSAEYQVVNGTLSSANVTFGHIANAWLMIVDAIIPAHVPVVYNDSTTETTAGTDSASTTMTMANAVTESLTGTDSASPGNVYVNQTTEIVTATDSATGGLIWNPVAAKGGSWSPASKPSTVWTPVSPPSTIWTKH